MLTSLLRSTHYISLRYVARSTLKIPIVGVINDNNIATEVLTSTSDNINSHTTILPKKINNTLVLQAIELSKRGMNSMNAGLLDQAVTYLEEAVKKAEEGLPLNDSDLFLFYEQLAEIYGKIPDFEKAEVIGNKTINLLKYLVSENKDSNIYHSMQLQLSRTIKNVGISCDMQNKLSHSELFFRQSLSILQAIIPAKNDKLISDNGNVIDKTTKQIQLDYDSDMSSVLYHLGSAIDKQADSARIVDELGSTFNKSLPKVNQFEKTRRSEAERYLRLSLAIREKLNKFNHTSCALIEHDLAVNLLGQDRVLEAEMMFRRSILSRQDDKDRDKNATYMMTLHSLADLYISQKQFRTAHSLYKKVTSIRKTSFGIDSPIVAATLESHAFALKKASPEMKLSDERTFQNEATVIENEAKEVRARIAKQREDAKIAKELQEESFNRPL